MRCFLLGVIVFGALPTEGMGQDSMQLPLPNSRRNKRQNSQSMASVSWILSPAPAPEEIKIHDIILILVDERSQQEQQRQFQRQRQGTYNVELGEFLRLDSKGRLANAAANSPTVDLTYERREQNRGNQRVLESLTYRIAASVTAIRPNGNLILGARKVIKTNRDAWVYNMTGEVNPKHIDAKDTVKSDKIANLNIIKNSTGKVRDSAKRGWMTRLLDSFSPF